MIDSFAFQSPRNPDIWSFHDSGNQKFGNLHYEYEHRIRTPGDRARLDKKFPLEPTWASSRGPQASLSAQARDEYCYNESHTPTRPLLSNTQAGYPALAPLGKPSRRESKPCESCACPQPPLAKRVPLDPFFDTRRGRLLTQYTADSTVQYR